MIEISPKSVRRAWPSLPIRMFAYMIVGINVINI
jgi:hypothetical protein